MRLRRAVLTLPVLERGRCPRLRRLGPGRHRPRRTAAADRRRRQARRTADAPVAPRRPPRGAAGVPRPLRAPVRRGPRGVRQRRRRRLQQDHLAGLRAQPLLAARPAAGAHPARPPRGRLLLDQGRAPAGDGPAGGLHAALLPGVHGAAVRRAPRPARGPAAARRARRAGALRGLRRRPDGRAEPRRPGHRPGPRRGERAGRRRPHAATRYGPHRERQPLPVLHRRHRDPARREVAGGDAPWPAPRGDGADAAGHARLRLPRRAHHSPGRPPGRATPAAPPGPTVRPRCRRSPSGRRSPSCCPRTTGRS